MRKMLRYAAVFFCLLLPTLSHAEKWIEVQSPHFRVVTDGSAGEAQHIANNFEQMRYTFQAQFGDSIHLDGPPLTVIAPRDAGTYSMVDPALWKARHTDVAGLFISGWEKQFAIVRLDEPEIMSTAVPFHEYTHSVMHASTHWLPIWLDEGLAEFYAYTRFQDHKIFVGNPTMRIDILRSQPLLSLDQLFSIDRRSPYYNGGGDDVQLFYAESWAVVHFMNFGPDMDHGHKLSQFIALLQTGMPQKKAFEQTFGPEAPFFNALMQYTRRLGFSAGVLPQSSDINEKDFATRVLSPAQVEYEVASFQLHSGNRTPAREHLAKALALDPRFAPAHEEQGFVLFQQGSDEAARTEWATALQLDPTLYRALFAQTMTASPPIAQQSPAQLEQTEAALKQITTLQPGFAAAWVEMSAVSLRNQHLQEAFDASTHAERLAPSRAGYHLLTGHLMLIGNHPDLAAQYASFVGQRWFGSDHDEALDLWNEIPTDKRGDNPPPPPIHYVAGLLTMRGKLTQAYCGEDRKSMTLTLIPEGKPDAKPVTFTGLPPTIIGFSDTLWWGDDHFANCFHLAQHPAVVVYKPSGAAGQVVELDIRDELLDMKLH